jgi:hypothetical protein
MKAYIKYISKLLCIGTIAMFTACKEHQEQKNMTTQTEDPISQKVRNWRTDILREMHFWSLYWQRTRTMSLQWEV